MDIAEEIV
jgi:superfamily II DNA helicase RecQ